jgi:hypothetical protein
MRAFLAVAKGMVSAECIAYARDMPGRPKAPKKKKAKKAAAKKPLARAKAKVKAKAKRRTSGTVRATRSKPKPKAKPRAKHAPAAAPSERALAASTQLPVERALSDDERDAMTKVADTARRFLEAVGGPDAVVHRIAAFIEEVRSARCPEPKSQDVRLGLGALWGEQVRAQVGWVWVHLTYPDGFASYAVVPDDRAFACFPLNRLQELMQHRARANTSVAVWGSIVSGSLPARRPNAYLVIG